MLMSIWQINEKIVKIFEEKRKSNPRFSVRAYAKQLDISNSSLSQIMRNKRVVGDKLAKKLEARLNTPLRIEGRLKRRESIKFENLDLEKAPKKFPWYVLALLEYFKVAKKFNSPSTLARQFAVSEDEILQTIRNLEVSQYLVKTEGGYQTNVGMTLSYMLPPVTNETAKEYQRKTIERSLKSVDVDPFEQRLHNSLFFRIDEKRMSEVRKCVERFHKDLAKLTTQEDSNSNKVYCTQVSCFPLLTIKDN